MNAKTIMPTAPSQLKFMILLHQPKTSGPPPAEFLAQIMPRFEKWMNDMTTKRHVLSTNGLDFTGVVLRGPRGGNVTDGPYTEAKEIIGGYILIQADDFRQAIELARACPGLDYQMAVEVRPIKSPP